MDTTMSRGRRAERRLALRRRRRLVLLVTVALLNLPALALATHVFTDVPDASTHAPGIHYVANAGITAGCTATAYCPNANVTRAQMGTFLHRASGTAPGIAPRVNARTVSAARITTVTNSNSVTNALSNTVVATCPAGTEVVGGGGLSGQVNLWVIEDSFPTSETTWQVRYTKRDGVAGNQTSTAYARCIAVGQ